MSTALPARTWVAYFRGVGSGQCAHAATNVTSANTSDKMTPAASGGSANAIYGTVLTWSYGTGATVTRPTSRSTKFFIKY